MTIQKLDEEPGRGPVSADKPAMTHRERVLAALSHQEPDRVPIAFSSTRSSIHVAGYEKLKRHLGIDAPSVISHRMQQCVEPDNSIQELFGGDIRSIMLGKADNGRDVELDERTYRDEWGVVREKPEDAYWYDLRISPLPGEITLQDIARYPWPDPDDPGRVRGLRQRALAIKEKGDYALLLNLPAGLQHTCQYLRGFPDWYMDAASDHTVAGALLDAVLEVSMGIARNAMAEVGDLIDLIFWGEDLGFQHSLQLSPATYRSLLKPRHAKFFRQMHEMCPHVRVALHSCGAIYPLINDLIEIGVDVLNPIQVGAVGMDPVNLKRDFGDRLTFWGGVDTQSVMPRGTVEEVKAEARRRIAEMAPGGGYIFSAVHNLQPDVPPENIVAMYQTAAEFGRYPIEG